MFKFSMRSQRGEDPNTDLAAFGFERETAFVVKPFLSECGRFAVDPTKAYGISRADADELRRLNKVLDAATQAATSNQGSGLAESVRLAKKWGIKTRYRSKQFLVRPSRLHHRASKILCIATAFPSSTTGKHA